jgi:hypothetical protein
MREGPWLLSVVVLGAVVFWVVTIYVARDSPSRTARMSAHLPSGRRSGWSWGNATVNWK